MGILFTILMGFLFTITLGILFTIVLGIQFTISTWRPLLKKSASGVPLIKPPTGSMSARVRGAVATTATGASRYPSKIFIFTLW